MSRHKRQSSSRSAPHRSRYTRRRAAGSFAGLLILAGLILADYAGVFGTDQARRSKPRWTDAKARRAMKASDIRTYHNKAFKVTHVVDGDTLDVNVDDELTGKEVTRIRLWGVDTPETVKPNTPKQHFGAQATRFTKDFCGGRTVRLELFKGGDTRGKYGRLLAYVHRESNDGSGACLNAELIGQGYGYSDPRYAHPRSDEFRQLQRRARENRVGLWAEARNGDLPYYHRKNIKLGR